MENQSSPYRPQATFATKANLVSQMSPVANKIDLSTANPAFRDIYEAYNQRVDQLNANLQNASTQATAAQEDVQKAYDITTQDAEGAYKTSVDNIGQANRDSQLANRIRARAIGGAPSSGFLDLANRTDLQSQKDVASAGADLTKSYRTADLTASQAYTAIINGLNNAIAQIRADASSSLLEKDRAIADVRERAARLASTVSNSDWIANLESLIQTEETPDSINPQVLGFDTYAIGSKTGGGLLYKPTPDPATATKKTTAPMSKTPVVPRSIPKSAVPNSKNNSLNLR